MRTLLILGALLLNPSAHADGLADVAGTYRGTNDCTLDIEVKEVVNLVPEKLMMITAKSPVGTASSAINLLKLDPLYRLMKIGGRTELELKPERRPLIGSYHQNSLKFSFAADGKLKSAWVRSIYVLAGQQYGEDAGITCADLIRQ